MCPPLLAAYPVCVCFWVPHANMSVKDGKCFSSANEAWNLFRWIGIKEKGFRIFKGPMKKDGRPAGYSPSI